MKKLASILLSVAIAASFVLTPAATEGYVYSVPSAIIILRSLVGLEELDEQQEVLYDVDKNNIVDVHDAIHILRHAIGLPNAIDNPELYGIIVDTPESTTPTTPSTPEPTTPSDESTEPSDEPTDKPTEPSDVPTEPSTDEPTTIPTFIVTFPTPEPSTPSESESEPTESTTPSESESEPATPSTPEPTTPSDEPTEPTDESTDEPTTTVMTPPTPEPTIPTTPEPTTPESTPEQRPQERLLAEEVLRHVNFERGREGLNPLVLADDDSPLTAAAQIRAEEITVYWSHDRPDGTSWATVFDEFNVDYRRAGENLAKWHSSPAHVMQGWMNSPGHRANIMRADYQEIGIGIVRHDGRLYWTQLFVGF